MADSAHLEKMGRELKCPICLSLINSAVSLTCNHVFCNLCIMKSMKADSNCPVCKVPYRRREVRPAPHMDSLVSIYKSMEAASGISIFVSQTAPVKVPAGQNQAEGGSNHGGLDTSGISNGKQKKQRIFRRKGLKELVNITVETSDHQLKPSFPAKKRVRVPQCLLSENQTHSEQSEGPRKCAENEPKDGSIVLKEKPVFNEQGEPVFSPFFWLRGEDDNNEGVERFTGQQTEDHVTDTPPPNVPSFSDIKDSDDESPNKMTPTGKAHSQSKVADVFDSEMFEWTQRACSPELCSTPVKSQVPYQDQLDGNHKEECESTSQTLTASNGEEPISESVKSITYQQGNAKTSMRSPSLLNTKNVKAQNGRKKLNRKGKRTNWRSQPENVKISMDEVPIDSSKIAGGSSGGCKFVTSDIAPKLGKKICKSKRASSDTTDVDKATEHATTVSIEAKTHTQGNECIGTVLPDLLGEDSKSGDNQKLKTSRSFKKITRYQRSHCKSLKEQNVDNVAKLLKEVPLNQNQGNENVTSQLSLSFCLKAVDGKTFDLEDKTSNSAKQIDMPFLKNCTGKLTEQKRLKISTDDGAKNVLADKALVGATKASVNKTQTITELYKDLDIRSTDNLDTTKKALSVAKDKLLQNCESFPRQIRCVFCLSSTISKASGEMMHYDNGRPVSADCNEWSNIIHSHRNCTEWAPNVYFQDDIAINLENEIARSRRIKCSCCGIKGAALGCYEKSCRKSFHVPCAKLVPQCRWDTENFVVLCPLHASLKLPKEISGSEGKRRKKSFPKGGSQAKQAEVITQHVVSESWLRKWPRSPHKWVICCSGLTVSEKGIVSDFTKMAGILMLTTFGPNVTHIIASTDENGACRRTLKFLMGILEGKWILKIDWVKACMKAMEPVAEEQYEINADIHGIRDGPRLGRLRVLSKQPKLFSGFKFYFMGEFIPSYKGYLQDLVVAAGGTVLQRKPVSGDLFGSSAVSTFIIYSIELTEECDSRKKTLCNHRRDEAEALASLTGAKVAVYSWVLDSIAASRIL